MLAFILFSSLDFETFKILISYDFFYYSLLNFYFILNIWKTLKTKIYKFLLIFFFEFLSIFLDVYDNNKLRLG